MNRWEAPDSLYAPVIAALPPGTSWGGFGNALIAAGQSVPVVEVPYNITRGFKKYQEVRDRAVVSESGDGAKPFTARMYLVDQPRDRQLASVAPTRLWEVGMTNVKDGLCVPAVPEEFDTAILQVNRFRLARGNQDGAPQLALVRHLWAENVRAASPDSIIFGGQHHWNESWWNEQVTTQEAG